MLRRSNYLIKWDVTLADIFQDLFVADEVGAWSCAFIMELGAREHAYLDFLSSTCRQDASATDVLITLSRVNIELNLDFKTLDKVTLLRDFAHFLDDIWRKEFFLRYVLALESTFHIFQLNLFLWVELCQDYKNKHQP